MSLLLTACLSFLKVGAFSFGGGYAVLAFIQKEAVEKFGWISPKEFTDIVAIAEMTPGPIAVNSSTFVGYRLAGVLGGVLCSLCTLLIPFLLSLIVAIYFAKFKDSKALQNALNGIRPAVIGLIAAACLTMGKASFTDWAGLAFFAIALFLVWKVKVNPIIVLVISGVLGAVWYGALVPLLL
ncbi:MAG: chromate transporter [Oscillospiraceae bacterium]